MNTPLSKTLLNMEREYNSNLIDINSNVNFKGINV